MPLNNPITPGPNSPEVFNQFNFPNAVRGNSYSAFSTWHNNISHNDEQYSRLLSIISHHFDISANNQWITRKSDGATLMGGWTYRSNMENRDDPSAGNHRHNPYGFNPSVYGFNSSVQEEFINMMPFEFWDLSVRNADFINEDGFERVYISSIEIDEVMHFLLWYIYYKNNNSVLYAGRYLWTGQVDNCLTYPYTHVSHAVYQEGESEPYVYTPADLTTLRNISPRGKPTVKAERTFTYLLRKINEKWDNLCKNEGAYTWLWFNQAVIALVRNRMSKGRLEADSWDSTLTKAKNVVEKYTGKEWIVLGKIEGIFPKKMCKSFYALEIPNNGVDYDYDSMYLILRWMKNKKWEYEKANSRIVWDAEEKMWFSSRCQVNVKLRKEGKTVIEHKMYTESFKKKFKRCHNCGYYVELHEHLTDEDLTINSCNFCTPTNIKNKINPRPDEANCYGGYHTHTGCWQFYYQRSKLDDPRCFCFGMEIEMHNNGTKEYQNDIGAKNAAWNILKGQWDIDYDLNNIYFERDGSLSSGGLEMVTNPMSLVYHQWYWTLMLPVMRKYCVGWDTEEFVGQDQRANNYGIHMTFNRNWWTDLQIARLIKFVDNPINNKFIVALAQRTKIYNGENLAADKYILRDKVAINKGKIVSAKTRYVPVNVKSKLVELRFFRTTLNTESFLKNIEWLFAFYEWIKNTPFSIDHDVFLKWLLSNQRAAGKYSNLFRYFSRKKFPVKGGALTNPWREQFLSIQGKHPLVFPIESVPRNTPENVLKGDIECV